MDVNMNMCACLSEKMFWPKNAPEVSGDLWGPSPTY
jgi:hypothetical protein